MDEVRLRFIEKPDLPYVGIATRAVKEAIKYGFDELDIKKFETFSLAVNVGSAKALEQNGFKLVKEFVVGHQLPGGVVAALV